MRKKIISLFFIMSLAITVFLNYKSIEEKDFIHILPKIENVELIENEFVEYKLFSKDNKLVNTFEAYFVGSNFLFNVPKGEYTLKSRYNDEVIEKTIIKKDEPLQTTINFTGDKLSANEKLILNTITGCLILFNLIIFFNIRNRIKKNKILYLSFYLLMIKLFLGLSSLKNQYYNEIALFTVTLILGFIFLFYLLEHVIDQKHKKLKYFAYSLSGFIFINNIFSLNITFSKKVFAYFINNHLEFLNFIESVNQFFHITKLIFLVIVINFLLKKDNLKNNKTIYYLLFGVTYFLMCFFSFIFPNSYNLYKFTCSIEHISIYWSLVFISLRIYRKSSLRIIRYILSFTLAYIAFFLFSSLRAPILILLSFIISDVYGIAFDKIFYVADEKVDKTYNRLCFCKTMEEFQNEYCCGQVFL